MLKKTLLTRKSVEERIIHMRTEKSKLNTDKIRSQNAKLTIDKTIFSGVQVTIAGKQKIIDEDLGRRSFSFQEGKLVQTIE